MDITGYTIPKGWKVLTWFRSVHLDPEIYPNPKEFNPNRWNVSYKKNEPCDTVVFMSTLFSLINVLN